MNSACFLEVYYLSSSVWVPKFLLPFIEKQLYLHMILNSFVVDLITIKIDCETRLWHLAILELYFLLLYFNVTSLIFLFFAHRLFGQAAACSACGVNISASEYVMRAGGPAGGPPGTPHHPPNTINVFHVKCFACNKCGIQLMPGDRWVRGSY